MYERHLDGLVERVREEYREMPGLSLTLPQARRLWGGADGEAVRQLLEDLVAQDYLAETQTGSFVRR